MTPDDYLMLVVYAGAFLMFSTIIYTSAMSTGQRTSATALKELATEVRALRLVLEKAVEARGPLVQ